MKALYPVEELIRLKEQGLNSVEIATKLGIHKTSVSKRLARAGNPFKRDPNVTVCCTVCGKPRQVPTGHYNRGMKKGKAFTCGKGTECFKEYLSRINRREKHPRWEGGDPRTSEGQRLRNTREYREWRKSVLERDGHSCQHCNANEELHAHHIKSFIRYPDVRFDIDNGITLCCTCHEKVHGRELRSKLHMHRKRHG